MAGTTAVDRKYNYHGLIPDAQRHELPGSTADREERKTKSQTVATKSPTRAQPTAKVKQWKSDGPLVTGLETLGLDPKWEQTLPYADTSILVTTQGRYRFEKMLPPLPPPSPINDAQDEDIYSRSSRSKPDPTSLSVENLEAKNAQIPRKISHVNLRSGMNTNSTAWTTSTRTSDNDAQSTIYLTEYLDDGGHDRRDLSEGNLSRREGRLAKLRRHPNPRQDHLDILGPRYLRQRGKDSRGYKSRGGYDEEASEEDYESDRRDDYSTVSDLSYDRRRTTRRHDERDREWQMRRDRGSGHDRDQDSRYAPTSASGDEIDSQSDSQTQSDYRLHTSPRPRVDSRPNSNMKTKRPSREKDYHYQERRREPRMRGSDTRYSSELRPRPPTARRRPPNYESVAHHDTAKSIVETITSVDSALMWPVPPVASSPRFKSETSFDTKTPVVIVQDSQSIDDTSTMRNHGEQPGEKLILERCCKAAPTFEDVFLTAFLRVFKHTLTGDLRLVTSSIDEHGTRSLETHRVKPKESKLVPMYAYDYKQRNLLFFQEDKGDNLGVGSTPSSSIEAMMLSPVYEFNSFQDALDFQGRILDEDVLFDISNIRFIRLAVTGSSERQIDSPRVQLWHQQKSTLRMKEGASFVTSGTSLSSADPERTVLLTSRLVMFLGRAQEFLTLFVTDDTTIKEKGPTTLIFHPTKYGGLDRWKSRKSIRCRLVTSTQGGAAGVRLDKKGLRNEDEETMYTQHKTFEMTFENEQGRVSFIQSWNHVLEARRAERMRLKKIASSMSASTFTGAVATKIIF